MGTKEQWRTIFSVSIQFLTLGSDTTVNFEWNSDFKEALHILRAPSPPWLSLYHIQPAAQQKYPKVGSVKTCTLQKTDVKINRE